MDIENPTAGRETPSLTPLAPRVGGLDGKRIGLYDNGKMAAEPVLAVLRGKLADAYDDVTFDEFSLSAKHLIQDPENQSAVEEWASGDLDVCIGAIGDCGSCTKYLVWGLQVVEEAGVPSVGLLDEGFVLDWQSNAVERGIPLRYHAGAVRSEVRDHDLIAERLTPGAIEGIEDGLTRPLTDKERGG